MCWSYISVGPGGAGPEPSSYLRIGEFEVVFGQLGKGRATQTGPVLEELVVKGQSVFPHVPQEPLAHIGLAPLDWVCERKAHLSD